MLNHINVPEYRQLVVELLTIVATILCRNPELTFNQPLDLRQLIKDAAHMYCKVSTKQNYYPVIVHIVIGIIRQMYVIDV